MVDYSNSKKECFSAEETHLLVYKGKNRIHYQYTDLVVRTVHRGAVHGADPAAASS